MMRRYAIAIATLAFTSQSFAADFPTGTLKGMGFLVEKGNMKITDEDLHEYSSAVVIKELAEDTYSFTISAQLQKSPSTAKKTDKRVDILNVLWESSNSGKLVNKNPIYRKDKTSFNIEDDKLILKSWIDRNQLWETHIYSLVD